VARWVRRVAVAGVVVLAAVQAVPYGRDHSNPAVRREPAWPSARVRDLARRACFDCHSNETVWPWYSLVAPASWLVQSDVESGRRHLNFSEWDVPQKNADEAAEVVEKGEMPPWQYLPAHPEARLTDAEKAELAAGLAALGGDGKGRGRGRDD
jgi:mono/diheme cytochrome c family protein